jgi:hypothetical protein
MRFSEDEILLALELCMLGLPWEPQPGHYVWDADGLIDCPSPFHDRVYFILDLKHFLRRAGTLEELKAALVWLPTWHDARNILESLGVSHAEVACRLEEYDAIEQQIELATLYRMIADQLATAANDQAASDTSISAPQF